MFKAIYGSAKTEYSFTKIKGLWKTSGNYASGESTNFTIFKQKIEEGLTPQAATLETPVGKVYQLDGYNKVEIITNNSEEVIVNFYK
ncbi:hypothetical protein JJC03_09780 [Flavobacterium oreochromis]|uniref:hypothetical protein n=1 Tax=Flavobacterium oreochromis TaxID=2906078 RepID=UPI001CE63BCF|nr:hypothetical protein [Flavobacterium oreochromis]QYS85511.1 hypothetical protein JJC03_09780 [Flavobacterium oreochromis]